MARRGHFIEMIQTPHPFLGVQQTLDPHDLLELIGRSPPNLLKQLEYESGAVYPFTWKLFIPIINKERNVAVKDSVYLRLTQVGWWNVYEIPENIEPTCDLTLSLINILAFRGAVDATHKGVYEAVRLALKYRLLHYCTLQTNYIGRLLQRLGPTPECKRIIILSLEVFHKIKWLTMLLQANAQNDMDTIIWLLAHLDDLPLKSRSL